MSEILEKPQVREYFTASWPSNHLRLLALVQASWVSQLIYFAVKHDVIERINDGYTNLPALADRLKIDRTILRRVIKGLEHLELVVEYKNQVELTELGELLVKGKPKNMAYMSLLWGEEFGRSWTKLSDAVMHETTGFEAYYDEKIFQYFAHEPESAMNFNFAMNSISQLLYPSIVSQLPVSNIKSIIDVGGGRGNLIKLIAEKYAHLKCSLYELDSVVSEIKVAGEPEKVELIIGDFFNRVPRADAHIMSNVLHDWNDDECIQILKNVRQAQTGDGYLFLLEMCVEHDKEPILARSTDMTCLLIAKPI